MNQKQHTLKSVIKLSGIGLHTGLIADIEIEPAAAGHGIKFQRIDLKDKITFDAHIDYVSDLTRNTTLEYKKAKISTVEHCLAALVGMQVDNALIKINGSELPILDGSSKPFTDAISKIGVVEQDEKRTFIEITEEISYFDSNNGVRFKILPSDKFELEVKIDYNSKVLGVQNAYLENIQDFQSTIAASRTFCFLHELNNLYENNLIKGGNLNNAVVFVDREIKDEEAYMLEKVLNKSEIEINDHGFLSNTDLRFENEPARHKLLDIIGDLALLGKPIKGKVIAFKPGHAANVAFAKLINKKIYSNII